MKARAVIVVLIAAALSCGCGTAQRADQAIGVADRPLPPEVRPVLTAKSHLRSGAEDLATSGGALWVAGFQAVSRLDPVTGRVVARIRIPGVANDRSIAVGDGSIWITSGITTVPGGVYRIDPSTDRVVAIIHVGGTVLGIAVGAGRVWVTRPTQTLGEVIRIDPQTNRVTGPPINVGRGPAQIAYGEGALWVENTSPPSVMRIDPATGNVSAVPVVGVTVVGYDSLWAASDDSLTRLQPKPGQVVASVRIPRGVAVAIGAGAVWVLAYPRSGSPTVFDPIKDTAALWEVDPSSNQIVGKPLRLDALQPIAITATDRNVWVADYNSGTVTRLRLVPCHATGCK